MLRFPIFGEESVPACVGLPTGARGAGEVRGLRTSFGVATEYPCARPPVACGELA